MVRIVGHILILSISFCTLPFSPGWAQSKNLGQRYKMFRDSGAVLVRGFTAWTSSQIKNNEIKVPEIAKRKAQGLANVKNNNMIIAYYVQHPQREKELSEFSQKLETAEKDKSVTKLQEALATHSGLVTDILLFTQKYPQNPYAKQAVQNSGIADLPRSIIKGTFDKAQSPKFMLFTLAALAGKGKSPSFKKIVKAFYSEDEIQAHQKAHDELKIFNIVSRIYENHFNLGEKI